MNMIQHCLSNNAGDDHLKMLFIFYDPKEGDGEGGVSGDRDVEHM